MATAPQLHRALGDIAGEGFEIVTLDLGGVGFIDSSGLQALVTAYERQLGDRLRILPCKRLVRLLDMTGTHGRLPVLAA
jgi:anti-sigma B factor antagonist